MVADKIERYEISYDPRGLHISSWQAMPSVGFGLIVLVILAACLLTDPYQGHARIWTSLGLVALALVALFGVRLESWVISENTICYKGSLWAKGRVFERPDGSCFIARLEWIPPDSEQIEPRFPHAVHLIGQGGIEIGDGFRVKSKANADRLLQTLRDASVGTDESEMQLL